VIDDGYCIDRTSARNIEGTAEIQLLRAADP
jgi:hypothetical protein